MVLLRVLRRLHEDAITVKYAITSHEDELVALGITKGSVTITLRGDDCRPVWN